MDEALVKAGVLSFIRSATGKRRKPVVTSEFTLGTSGVRADLAILAEDFIGIEIKTEKDTLKRLKYQMEAYQYYFQSVILVTARCHIDKIDSDMLYGASVWTYDNQCRHFEQLNEGKLNRVSVTAIADLMTQAERKHHPLCTENDTAEIGFHKLSAILKKRYAQSSQKFWRSVARRNIQPSDLALLSRFAEERQQAKLSSIERETRWSNWLAAQGVLAVA